MKIPAVFPVLPSAHSPACSFHRLNLSPAPCFINSAMNTLTIESLKQRSHVANSQCPVETDALNVGLSIVLRGSGSYDEPEDNGVSQRADGREKRETRGKNLVGWFNGSLLKIKL